jgi:hypothetical protein
MLSKRPHADWPLHVRLDFFLFDTLDRTNNCDWNSHNGDFLYLPCCLQLPRRHLPSICEFCFGGPELLPKHHGRNLSPDHESDVHQTWVWACEQSSWWNWDFVDTGALGFVILWTKDSGKKQVCERNYGVASMSASHGLEILACHSTNENSLISNTPIYAPRFNSDILTQNPKTAVQLALLTEFYQLCTAKHSP